ncbi:hypothetical protein LINPERPRIM_LOCUS27275 [Linum perenne]
MDGDELDRRFSDWFDSKFQILFAIEGGMEGFRKKQLFVKFRFNSTDHHLHRRDHISPSWILLHDLACHVLIESA